MPKPSRPGQIGRLLIRSPRDAIVRLALATALGSVAAGASGSTQTPSTPRATLRPAKATGVATATGSIRGRADRDFVIQCAAGQTLDVALHASSLSAYFNVLPPGSNDVAMFIGGASGNEFHGIVPATGDYVVRIYLVRSAARRQVTSTFTLTARKSGTAFVPLPAREDATVPGTPYHATATVHCVLPYQPEVKECEAGVIRYDHSGTATVEMRGPRHFLRRVLFVKGVPTASDATESPTASRSGDTITVSIGADERYEIPEALLIGG